MLKRFVSLLLALCLLLGLLPSGILPAAAVTEERSDVPRYARIAWGDSGESCWNYYYDPETGEVSTSGDALPEGVTFDEGIITLSGASLYLIDLTNWENLPVKVIVEGENRIVNRSGSLDESALHFHACHDVTIEGSGSLYLESARIPLESYDVIPDTSITWEDGSFVIRDVSLTMVNNYADEVFTDDTAWMCSAMAIHSNTLIDGADLYIRGHNGFNTTGSTTITGGAKIDADGFNVSCRPYAEDDGNNQYYDSAILIEDADLDITVHRNKCDWDYFVFEIGPGCDLIVRDGADITVDCSESSFNMHGLIIHDDYLNSPGPATMTMEGGRIHVITAPLEAAGGIDVATGAVWDQYGGDVLLEASHPDGSFSLWDGNATVNLYGGSITIRDTNLSIADNTHWNQYGGDVRIERSVTQNQAMWIGNYASFTMTDGSFTMVNSSEEVVAAAPDFRNCWAYAFSTCSTSDFTIAGGAFAAEGDWVFPAALQGSVVITGGDVRLPGLQVGPILENGCTMAIAGGTVTTSGGWYSMEICNGCGLNMLGGTLLCQDKAMVLWHGGYARFLGGETVLTGEQALVLGHDDASFVTYGDGICAAYADGTAAELEQREDGWLAINSLGETVTIKAQSAAASATNILLSMTDPDRVTAGVSAGVKMICLLDEPEGTVNVTLPLGASLVENSVYRNGLPVEYTLTGEGFSVNVGSGSLVTFTIRPVHTGSALMSASFGSYETELEVLCSAYRLTVPNIVDTPTFPLSGTAAANATLVFYCDAEALTTVKANSLGTWTAGITLPGEGYHYLYAILYAEDGACLTVTEPYRVLYDPNGIVAESLTISNWIHGNTSLDPHVLSETVIDYSTGKTSPGYYVYWPDLPEFTLTAKFADGEATPDTVYNVQVVATDRHGVSVTVPLEYDADTDTWVGREDFCCDGTITPERFQLQYRCYIEYPGLDEPDWVPDHLPEASEEDSSDGAAILVTDPGEAYTVRLSADAEVESLTDGLGQDVEYTLTDGSVTFPVEPGECYVLKLRMGSFPDHPGVTTLSISIAGGSRGDYTYQDNVHLVTADALSNRTETTFTAAAGYAVDDVLLIDGTEALAITRVSGTTYTYEYAALDQIYAYLDVSGIDPSKPMEVQWGTDKETLLQEFLDSAAFRRYMDSLEYTLSEWAESKKYEFELGDVKADIALNYGYNDDGTIYVNPIFTITTKMTTKLPWEGELETEVVAKLGYRVEENLNYRIRSRNDDLDVQSYMLFTNETVTADLHLGVTVGEDPNAPEEYFSDFEKALEELKSNFLEELEEDEEDSFNPLKDVKIQIPTPVPAITVFLSPGMEVEWTFFGEMTTDAQVVNRSTKGILITHLGSDYLGDWRDWSVNTFSEVQDPYAELTTTMHLSASLGLMLRIDLGVCVAQCIDLGLYAEAGPKVTVSGHGYFAINSDGNGSSSAELLAALILEAEAGASASISLKKLPIKLPKWEQEIYSAVLPLAEIGQRIMPWEYVTVEEGPIYIRSVCSLREYINLTLKCQYFNVDGSITDGKQLMDLDDYEFELLWSEGAIVVAPNGDTTVIDTEKEFDFQIKVTYTGSSEDYKIWKLVDMAYSPSSLTIYKTAEEVEPVASFEIINLTNPYDPVRSATTSSAGVVTIPVATGCTYEIHETCPPPKNRPTDPLQVTYVNGEGSVSFGNYIPEDPEPYEPPAPDIPPIGDPSGYVFEGIESNRLEGVTAALYVADDENGTNAALWDAAPYDQQNPLLTDSQGQYQWMVPDGWWQVRYTLEGYESAESEWMVVPPIRTGVNQNLVSDAPAEMTVRYSEEEQALAVLFSRPVIVGSAMDVTITADGQQVNGWLSAIDSAWSVTEDPMDSRICATAFQVSFSEDADVLGRTITVSMSDVTTYYGTSCGAMSAEATIPDVRKYHVSVERGTGSGYYEPGETVTVRAYEVSCNPFDHWDYWGIDLADNTTATISFTMPEGDVGLSAWYSEELVHAYEVRIYAPSCVQGGFTTHTCTKCGDSYTDSYTDPLGHDWNGLECSRCDAIRDNPFTDVQKGSFYYESVMWAVKSGITNGTSDTTFGPNDQCMRAHVVTFLWRAAGEPEPASDHNPFVDVKPTDFYYKAVLWAVEKGITNGVDATHFGPFTYCNRAQVVTFLYRSMGSPAVDSADNPFTDVVSGSFYEKAVLWAVKKGITNGLSATAFGPNAICNRAQIVTFLYRAFT